MRIIIVTSLLFINIVAFGVTIAFAEDKPTSESLCVTLDANERWKKLPSETLVLGGCIFGGVRGLCKLYLPEGRQDFLVTDFYKIWDCAPVDGLILAGCAIRGEKEGAIAVIDVRNGAIIKSWSSQNLKCACFGSSANMVNLFYKDPGTGVPFLLQYSDDYVQKELLDKEYGSPLHARWTPDGILVFTETENVTLVKDGATKMVTIPNKNGRTIRSIDFCLQKNTIIIGWLMREGIFSGLEFGITLYGDNDQKILSQDYKVPSGPPGSLDTSQDGGYVILTTDEKGPATVWAINIADRTENRIGSVLGGRLGLGVFPGVLVNTE